MSKQDVRDELKDTEGNPHVKARIRRIRVMRARQRMMAKVPDSDRRDHQSNALRGRSCL